MRVLLSTATTQPKSLSHFLLVASKKRKSAGCRTVVLSLASQRDVANPLIWPEQQCDIATTRRTTSRRLVCSVSARTTRPKCDNAPFWRFVVLSLATTQRTKVFQISHHMKRMFLKCRFQITWPVMMCYFLVLSVWVKCSL
jgi:hypothetical protein